MENALSSKATAENLLQKMVAGIKGLWFCFFVVLVVEYYQCCHFRGIVSEKLSTLA